MPPRPRRPLPRFCRSLVVALAIVAGCGGSVVPFPTVTDATSSPIATGTSPATSIQPASTELVLGQTFGLVYDPELAAVVLVNGAIEGGRARPTELWRWDGETWGLIDDAGPPARSFAAVSRDPQRGVIVVHGGLDERGTPFDETIEWDGRAWTTTTDTGPGPREGAGLAYDAATARLLLFGGAVDRVQPDDTWAWDGTSWEAIASSGPPRPRFVSLMTQDRAAGGILLQGGHWVDGDAGDFLADTWRWRDGTWVEVTAEGGPGPRVNSPGAWDERVGGIVMVGGGSGMDTPFGADTWVWTDRWTQAATSSAPSPRNGHAIAFDEARQVLVLVGGISVPGGSQTLDVWELDDRGWREVLPAAR